MTNWLYELDPRISLLRGHTKAAAAINTRTAYGLHGGSAQVVQVLLQRKQYIYPPAATPVSTSTVLPLSTWLIECKAQGFRRDRPFEHPAIIGTLHDDLLVGPNTIVMQYPGRFPQGAEHTFSLTPAIVALAATTVSS